MIGSCNGIGHEEEGYTLDAETLVREWKDYLKERYAAVIEDEN